MKAKYDPLENVRYKLIKVINKRKVFNLLVKKYFLKPDFNSNFLPKSLNIKIIDLKLLDILLWEWKSNLSREWYPFIFGLKQDLQINKNFLTLERKIKTQTAPLSEFLIKGEM